MSMRLFNYIAGTDTPTLTSVDRAIFLAIAVKCDDMGRLLCTQKAMAFILRMDRGHFSRKVKELVGKGFLARSGLGIVVSEAIVKEATLLPDAQPALPAGQQGWVAAPSTRVASEALPFPPHPITPNKNINNHEYSIDPPIIPPTQNTTAQKGDGETEVKETNFGYTDLSRNSWEAAERQDATNVTVVPAQTWWERQCTRKPWSQVLEERRQAYLASQPKYTKEQDAFLDVYPKAPADPAAFVIAWEQTLKQDVLPRELIDAARIAANSPPFKENEGQYVPKPEKWLGAKNWAQIVEPWRAERKRRKQEREAKDLERQLMMEEFDE